MAFSVAHFSLSWIVIPSVLESDRGICFFPCTPYNEFGIMKQTGLPAVLLRTLLLALFAILLLPGLTSCRSWDIGIGASAQEQISNTPPARELYRLYQMCLAVWKEQESWLETGWELTYLSDPQTNTLGLCIEEDRTLYLAFRATQAPDNRIDSAMNLDFALSPLFFISPDSLHRMYDGPVLKAHAGLQDKYAGIRGELLQQVDQFAGETIIITGHSAGGMTAYLAYIDLKLRFPEKEFLVVTFGMPRVLNFAAARFIESTGDPVYRYVMRHDFLVTIPPILFGYSHAGTEVLLGKPSPIPYYSFDAHESGYLHETLQMLKDEGTDPADLGFLHP